MVLEEDSSFNLSNISWESKSKVITRKNAFGSRTIRDFDGNLNESILEIEKHCSARTVSLVRKLAEDYRKMKSRGQESEKR